MTSRTLKGAGRGHTARDRGNYRLKAEAIRHEELSTRNDARNTACEYLESHYNRKHLYSGPGWLSFETFEQPQGV